MTSPAELAKQVRDALDESMRLGARQSARLIRLTKEGQAALSVLEARLEQAEKALTAIEDAANNRRALGHIGFLARAALARGVVGETSE